MKKIFAILLSTMILASFAACGTAKADDTSSAQPSSSESSAAAPSDAVSIPASSEADAQTADARSERLMVADAYCFTGTLQDLAVNEKGETVWHLMIDNTEITELNVAINADTKFSFDSKEVGNGAKLEVYFGEDPKSGNVTAIAVNRADEAASSSAADGTPPAAPADALTYDGEVVSVTADAAKPGEGSVEMKSLQGDNAYIFHFSSETYIGIDLSALHPGDKLRVLHSPIATRSIPPQSPAYQILPYEDHAA